MVKLESHSLPSSETRIVKQEHVTFSLSHTLSLLSLEFFLLSPFSFLLSPLSLPLCAHKTTLPILPHSIDRMQS